MLGFEGLSSQSLRRRDFLDTPESQTKVRAKLEDQPVL
jgi:hypothetical protein